MSEKVDLVSLRARAMEFSHTGIIITDARLPDNPIIDCNPAFEVITGYSRKEVLGRNCRFLQGDDADQATIAAIRRAISHRQYITVVIKNYTKSGILFWNELSISPVFDRSDQLTHFIGIQNNVTVRETARLELAAEHTELSQMNNVLQQKVQQQKDIDARISELLKQSHSF